MGTIFSLIRRALSAAPVGAQMLGDIAGKEADTRMQVLLQELRRADVASMRDVGSSIFDLYVSITTNFGTIDGLKAAPSKAMRDYIDMMLDLQGRMGKADTHAWAVTRLFNQWVRASLEDSKEEAAKFAGELAYFMPGHQFPPDG